MNINATVDGVDNVIGDFGAMADGAKGREMAQVVTDLAEKVVQSAKSRAPVYTGDYAPPGHEPGNLRDNGIGKNIIHYDDTGLTSAYIGFTQAGWYGIYPEFGTVNMAARPFMIPAFEEMRPDLISGITNGFFETVMGRFF